MSATYWFIYFSSCCTPVMWLETSRPDHSEIPASNFISKDRFDRKSPPYMMLSCLLRCWKYTYFPDGCLSHIGQITLKLASWPSKYSKHLKETKKVMLDMSLIKEVSCNLALETICIAILCLVSIFTHQTEMLSPPTHPSPSKKKNEKKKNEKKRHNLLAAEGEASTSW